MNEYNRSVQHGIKLAYEWLSNHKYTTPDGQKKIIHPELLREFFDELMKDSEGQKFTVEDAVIIAATAHKGQFDKSGMPYILHPIRVMQQMKTMHGKMAGVLHDVVEDTDVTLEDLRKAGCPYDVVQAVDCVSRREDEKDYDGFISRIIESKNNLAVELKINDIRDNCDPARLQYLPPEKRENLIARYMKALERLIKEC